jgi:hypothetical protein
MPVSAVQRQVQKASRRLFVQTLLERVACCWAGGIVLAALWFLAQPWIVGQADPSLRWSVAGGIFVAGTALGVCLAWRAAPSRTTAVLELDRRFNLKERLTTSFTLPTDAAQTQAGLALLADAEAHATKLKVSDRFPVRLSWTALLPPAAALGLALIAWLYHPVISPAEADTAEGLKVANAAEIAEKFNKLKKAISPTKLNEDVKNDKLDDLDALREKLLNQELDPKDKDSIRESLQKMISLEEKMKDRLADLKGQQERNKNMQDQLKQMGIDPKNQLKEDGPAKAAADALNKGNFQKAQKELQALAKKLKEAKLTDAEMKQLENQLKEMQEKLQNLAEQKDRVEELNKELEAGKISKEDFDRKMAQIGEEKEALDKMKLFAKAIGECKACIAGGNGNAAGAKLDEIVEMMRRMDPSGDEREALASELQLLEDLQEELKEGMVGGGGAPRHAAENGPQTGAVSAKQKGAFNPDTAYRVTGERKGGTFSPIPAGQVGGAYQKAQQDAPQAIERQQVPPDAAEMLRGYYENLGGNNKK